MWAFRAGAVHAVKTLGQTVEFVETMLEVASNPELTRIVYESIQLMPEERSVVLKLLRTINERKRKLKLGKKSPPGTK